ncbi:recombination protein RecR [Mycoplasmopsis agassizii]|uniref:Recombination protein RecR n=1 Tax=Mycoplasmopsis agassizii TaxID=33922 RepID=A0A269TIT6_9BACT|nr:toprim domain-containing protein [Mycoplasmopsis agassizii]PAK21321.1 recombination protein RecR [Mycoplasmopsis agassizii]
MASKTFENLVESLTKLDSVSKRSAAKLANDFLKLSEKEIEDFTAILNEARAKNQYCKSCNLFQEMPICTYCLNTNLDKSLLISESSQNIFKFASIENYHGYFFVSNPLLKIRNQIASIAWKDQLINFVEKYKIEEIILAISPTLNGEITITYIKNLFADHDIKITRLALGIPVNSDIDYIDNITLKSAVTNRVKG